MSDFNKFAAIQCYKCGIVFGVPAAYKEKRQEDCESFWCPNGHSQHYTESSSDILRRERDRLKQQLARKDDEISAAIKMSEKAKRDLDRLKRRANAGLCPCCNRHFTDLERHMASKHKDEVKK